MSFDEETVRALVAVLLVMGAFLGIRRFWWWYWGIDRMVDALEDIAASLRTFPSVRQLNPHPKGRRISSA